ncbi:MAG: UDP-N-acetylmuramoyl-tripeptide--D-alanyl-D-alanine ligase [Sulfitobacter sp.]|nr:UDP-N-acetylmuramoyl-tripeptide--D-alanyl-D-alanine ligase [Sulfitobacter sp.]
MSLWTSADAAAATGGEPRGDWACTGISIDTRTLAPGDLFVALKDVRDGHDFVVQALEKGAAAALVSHIPEGVAEDAPLLMVSDVQEALEALGRAGRARMRGKVAAITGSVGKTSTKEMLLTMLSDQGRTHGSVASYNNHWGVPLTLARMPADTEWAVIEIGMNHPGEIAPLAAMAAPHVAMITTVAPAHLEAFDDIEGIAREKASIFEGLLPGGTAVINADIETAPILRDKAKAENAQLLDFGVRAEQFHLADLQMHEVATVVQARALGAPLLFKIGSPGRHFVMNGLGALATCHALGLDMALAAQSLGRWQPFAGRGQRETIHLDPVEPAQAFELIDDSYNANPASMAAALEVLSVSGAASGAYRRIAILGDMKELGPDAEALHAGLAKLPAMDQIDQVHCIGPLSHALYAALPEHRRGIWVQTSEELVPSLSRLLNRGDVVMAKGSLSMRLGVIVDAIRKMGHRGETA